MNKIFRIFSAPSATRQGALVGNASKRCNCDTVTLGSVTHYLQRVAMMLLLMLLTTATAWAETVDTYFIDENGNSYTGTMAKENDAYAINGKTLRPYTTETIAMNAAGIRTYASEYDLDFTNVSGLTAYVATSISGNTLTLTRAYKVPGGTGLLLKGTANGNFSVHTTGSATAIATNMLVGLTEETEVSQQQTIGDVNYLAFILANGDYGINWYKLAETSYTLKANSAYLRLPTDKAPTESRALTMVFE